MFTLFIELRAIATVLNLKQQEAIKKIVEIFYLLYKYIGFMFENFPNYIISDQLPIVLDAGQLF